MLHRDNRGAFGRNKLAARYLVLELIIEEEMGYIARLLIARRIAS
jgi:hypothetical protein